MGKKAAEKIAPILRAGVWIRYAGPTPLERKTSYSRPGNNENFLTGFTFIELIIILLILSFTLLIVLPNFKNILPETQLSSSARRITAQISWLYHEAGLSGRKCRLNFDLEKGVYWTEKETADGQMKKLRGNLQEMKKLLPGVSFRDIVTETGKEEEEVTHIDFSPYGFAEPAIIHLVNSQGQELSIIVNSFTGRAKIHDGYVEEK